MSGLRLIKGEGKQFKGFNKLEKRGQLSGVFGASTLVVKTFKSDGAAHKFMNSHIGWSPHKGGFPSGKYVLDVPSGTWKKIRGR